VNIDSVSANTTINTYAKVYETAFPLRQKDSRWIFKV